MISIPLQYRAAWMTLCKFEGFQAVHPWRVKVLIRRRAPKRPSKKKFPQKAAA